MKTRLLISTLMGLAIVTSGAFAEIKSDEPGMMPGGMKCCKSCKGMGTWMKSKIDHMDQMIAAFKAFKSAPKATQADLVMALDKLADEVITQIATQKTAMEKKVADFAEKKEAFKEKIESKKAIWKEKKTKSQEKRAKRMGMKAPRVRRGKKGKTEEPTVTTEPVTTNEGEQAKV